MDGHEVKIFLPQQHKSKWRSFLFYYDLSSNVQSQEGRVFLFNFYDASTALGVGLVFIRAWSNRTFGEIFPSLRRLSSFSAFDFSLASKLFLALESFTGITRTDGI
jgi:hypothetical protein